MHTWQLQEAKSRFSELVDLSLKDGPQLVTRRGHEAVVVLAAADYRHLSGDASPADGVLARCASRAGAGHRTFIRAHSGPLCVKYLLDICVLSELVKHQPEPRLMRWMQARKPHELCISELTLAE